MPLLRFFVIPAVNIPMWHFFRLRHIFHYNGHLRPAPCHNFINIPSQKCLLYFMTFAVIVSIKLWLCVPISFKWTIFTKVLAQNQRLQNCCDFASMSDQKNSRGLDNMHPWTVNKPSQLGCDIPETQNWKWTESSLPHNKIYSQNHLEF